MTFLPRSDGGGSSSLRLFPFVAPLLLEKRKKKWNLVLFRVLEFLRKKNGVLSCGKKRLLLFQSEHHFPQRKRREETKSASSSSKRVSSLRLLSRAKDAFVFFKLDIYTSQNSREERDVFILLLHDICCAISTSARRFDEEVFVLFVFVVLIVVANGEDENLRHGDREGR